MPRKEEPVDPASIFRQFHEKVKQQVTAPNIYRYTPHDKQYLFHTNPCKGRLFVAGNRSGKSLSSVVEGIWWATGTHPYRNTPPTPTRGRVVAVDFLNGVDKIILPLYKQWLPTEFLIDGLWEKSYSAERHTLTLANGSFIEFMSQDQDLDKFAGSSRHWVHFDEECPKVIFEECLMRLIDTDGDWWISETPVAGMEWIYDDLYEPAISGARPDVGLIEASMDENPHISASARERLLAHFTPEERAMRERGEYTTVTGQLFKLFKAKPIEDGGNIVASPQFTLLPRHRLYLCGDHGFNAPTAWLWVAVDTDGSMVIFKEHYQAQMTVADHAQAIKDMNAEIGREPYLIVGDPAMNQKSGITGDSILAEYARHGIHIQTNGIPRDRMVGINKVNQYLKPNPKKMGIPFLTMTDECPNTIREFKGAKAARHINRLVASRKNAPEGQRDKDDHTTDSIRYLITLMPDLTFEHFNGTAKPLWDDFAGMLGGVAGTYTGYDDRKATREFFGWRNIDGDAVGLEG